MLSKVLITVAMEAIVRGLQVSGSKWNVSLDALSLVFQQRLNSCLEREVHRGAANNGDAS